MNRIHLATALVRRHDAVLLVASRYANQSLPLWNLPGGRQQPGEMLNQTALRELSEETGLQGTIRELAYVSESYDADTHFTNFTFVVEVSSHDVVLRQPFDRLRVTTDDKNGDHIEAVEWVPKKELASRIAVAVVREPLLAYLAGSLPGYAGYPEAGITIVFPD